ncbi:YIP1 family protein [Paracoccus aestuarii]|uniref:YIP1 family protein n=1 Tax=Paracoccus aestuarii TaxID=453842 RepID=A0A418ZUV5_9RHOB|nr:Yip1 family protein [Paracoccus aestuarii]RJL03398.1 YIP1 family protein [Paracoccus aestuarii]WCR00451.1 YIP1 family protein [Paracoccus aestuarii]
MTTDDFKALVRQTFRNPEDAARWLIAQNWPMQARWMALVTAVSISGVLAYLSVQLFPIPEGETPMLPLGQQPLVLAGMQLFAIIVGAGLMAGVGRMFGGHGRFEDALLLAVWIEVMLLIVQVLQIVFTLILPPLAGMLGILAIALFLWLTVQFTKALHGFTSAPKILLVMFATLMVMGFVLSFFMAGLGLMPEMPQ